MFWSRNDVPEAPPVDLPEKDHDSPFDEILDKMDDILSAISSLSSKLTALETKVKEIEGPAQKLAIELADAKSQLRKNTDFTQALVMELISHPRQDQAPTPIVKEPSSALKEYLAKKANGSDHKPKLP